MLGRVPSACQKTTLYRCLLLAKTENEPKNAGYTKKNHKLVAAVVGSYLVENRKIFYICFGVNNGVCCIGCVNTSQKIKNGRAGVENVNKNIWLPSSRGKNCTHMSHLLWNECLYKFSKSRLQSGERKKLVEAGICRQRKSCFT